MEKLTKQDTGKSGSGTTRENYSADEIAQESSYQDSTEVAQQMHQLDHTKSGSEQPESEADAGRSAAQGTSQSGKK